MDSYTLKSPSMKANRVCVNLSEADGVTREEWQEASRTAETAVTTMTILNPYTAEVKVSSVVHQPDLNNKEKRLLLLQSHKDLELCEVN